MVLGPLIGAGASLLGGILGANRADDAADQAWDRQKKLAQNQIQWKVQDAVAAGLHPLAGLGVTPMAGPAASVGGEILGQGIADMGQGIGRAAEALMTPQDKVSSRMIELQMERSTLENDLLRTQIASQRMRNVQQTTPGVPGRPILAGGGQALPFTDNQMPTKDPGIAQQAENNYGEIVGNILGMGAAVQDVYKYLQLEKLLTGDDWTPRAQQVLKAVQPYLPKAVQPGYKAQHLMRYK